ncbi:hypothetical protein [Escherichia coli]|uniref:hypothetical protein n=1 Tax=Escherichia coli TaxID=562 RepID=UPI0012FD83A4|nr:hypothetical protein [Escherichia coli]
MDDNINITDTITAIFLRNFAVEIIKAIDAKVMPNDMKTLGSMTGVLNNTCGRYTNMIETGNDAIANTDKKYFFS